MIPKSRLVHRKQSSRHFRFESLENRSLLSATGLFQPEASPPESVYDPAQILVRFQDSLSQPQALLPGTEIGPALGLVPGLHSVTLSGVTVEEAIAAYQASPSVLYAQPDYQIRLNYTPNDPGYTGGYLWGLHNTGQNGGTLDADIDAPEAWDMAAGNNSVIVAVIDSGVDYTHPDLAVNIWTNSGEIAGDGLDNDRNGYIDDVRGWDFANNDADPMDDNGHGTHVAGTIGAAASNGRGVTGVSSGVQLMPLKFIGADGSGSLSGAIAAINYAVSMGAQISNNSWGGGGYLKSMYEAIQAAMQTGHLFIAAAGNDNLNNDRTASYPANYQLENVISVAATDNQDRMAAFSHWGATTVDLAAPGVDIVSTTPGNTYSYMSGTSMAAPHVTGAAALLWSSDSSLSLAEVRERLLGGTDSIGKIGANSAKPTVTNGRLNAANSLRPDLQWQSLAVPQLVYAGDDLTFTRSYRVSGSATTGDFNIVYFASADGTLGNAEDVMLGSETIDALADRAVGVHTATVSMLSALEAGTYQVYARLDSANAVTEFKEANNVSAFASIHVGELPQLVLEVARPPGLNEEQQDSAHFEGDLIAVEANLPTGIEPVSYQWRVTRGPVELLSATNERSFSFTPLDADGAGVEFNIELTVTALLNGSLRSLSASLPIAVSDRAPNAHAGGPYVIVEGEILPLDASQTSDPAGMHDPLVFQWFIDVDRDGVFGETEELSSDAIANVEWIALRQLGIRSSVLPYDVLLRVADADDRAILSEVRTSLLVQNIAPTAVLTAPATAIEGQPFVIAFEQVTDPSIAAAGGEFRYNFDLDGDGDYSGPSDVLDSVSSAVEVSFADNGLYQVLGQVRDDQGAVSSHMVTINVVNVAPSAEILLGNEFPTEGVPFEFGLQNVDDAASDLLAGMKYSFDLDGDGEFELADADEPVQTATLSQDGVYTLRARVHDKDGGSSEYEALVVVQNAPPVVEVVDGPASAKILSAVTFTGRFSDSGADAWEGVATITSPEGFTTEAPLVIDQANRSFTLAYSFESTGTHTVSVSISDGQRAASASLSKVIEVQSFAGDFDGDLDVDGSDFLDWQRRLSPESLDGGTLEGDLTRNLGQTELDLWRSDFGKAPLQSPTVHARHRDSASGLRIPSAQADMAESDLYHLALCDAAIFENSEWNGSKDRPFKRLARVAKEL